jgi:ankyrin repeat protein
LHREDVDVNLKDKNGWTPIAHAVQGKSVEVVKLLLVREDVDINLRNKHGRTPISYAIESGSVEIIRLFLAQEHVDVNYEGQGWADMFFICC